MRGAGETMDGRTNSKGRAKAARLPELRTRYRTHLDWLGGDSGHPVRFDFSRVFPETRDLQALVAQVDDLKLCLDSFRPLNPAQAANLQDAVDIEYTYDSNRIEGNTLTHQETAMVTLHGLTITPEQQPGILMPMTIDAKGDIDRESFLVEVQDGKQKVTQILPKLN